MQDLRDSHSVWLISTISILLIYPHVTKARGGNHFSNSERISPRPESSSDIFRPESADPSRFRFLPNQLEQRSQYQHSEPRLLAPAADVSCTGPDRNTCGTLTLYTCERAKRFTDQSGVDAAFGSCRVDEYARVESANLLRCRANLTELRSRFSFNQSIIGT